MMTLDQIRRMACACAGPEYHQTGNARCAISILLALIADLRAKTDTELLETIAEYAKLKAASAALKDGLLESQTIDQEVKYLAHAFLQLWRDVGIQDADDWLVTARERAEAAVRRSGESQTIDLIEEAKGDLAVAIMVGDSKAIERATDALIAAVRRSGEPETFQRCEGRYLVPHQRSEPFDVTYRCMLRHGHLGPCGSEEPGLRDDAESSFDNTQ